MIGDQFPDVAYKTQNIGREMRILAAECPGGNEIAGPLPKFCIVLVRDSQHFANDGNRHWEGKFGDELHLSASLHLVDEIVGNLFDMAAQLADVLGLERLVR